MQQTIDQRFGNLESTIVQNVSAEIREIMGDSSSRTNRSTLGGAGSKSRSKTSEKVRGQEK